MKYFVHLAYIVAICVIPIHVAQAAAKDILHPTLQGEQGPLPLVIVSSEPGVADTGPAAPLIGGERDGSILWTRHFEDPIYSSTGIATTVDLERFVLAGNYYSPPMHTEGVPILGGGVPDWTFNGTRFFVDASQEAGVLASVDFGSNDSTATVRCWDSGSGTPLWSYVIYPCRTMVYQGWASRKPIQVSADGAIIAVAVTMWAGGGAQIGRLTAFSSESGIPIVEWDFPTGNVVTSAISLDGAYVVMGGWPNIYVYDIAADALRWSGPAGAGNDALAISGDGEYIAWGWTTFHLRRWTGSTYDVAWTHTPGGGLYVGQCALDHDGGTLAVAWDNGNDMVNFIAVDLYDLPDVTPLWHYDYVGTPPSTHVDIPSTMVFSPDGDRLAIGSWGGSFPEIHVFERSGPQPLFTLDTQGSIFDIDIVSAPGSGSYVTACGKSVHAGTGGRGGDLYAIEIDGSNVGLPQETPLSTPFGLVGNYPNPFNPRTEIRFRLPDSGPMELTVHDTRGRFVKQLRAGHAESGEQTVVWSGEDTSGRQVASGVYLLRLRVGEMTDTRKIMLIE